MNSTQDEDRALTINSHILGYPRMGARRQLKWALEDYWAGSITATQLLCEGQALREQHWQQQIDGGLDFITVGDFAFYDQVLNHSLMFGVIPQRFKPGIAANDSWDMDTYFRMARGRSARGEDAAACEMTKWFDTNYHYIVPEFSGQQSFKLNASQYISEIKQAQQLSKKVKPVIIGPLTYLWLGKAQGEFNKLNLLPDLVTAYRELLHEVASLGIEWVQIDEPILVLDLPPAWQQAFEAVYNQLNSSSIQLMLTTYFGELKDNLNLACQLPVAGLHLDVVRGADQLKTILDRLPPYKVLSLGIINGRNIWAADLDACLATLRPFVQTLKKRLWLSSSCSLLHVPLDVEQELGFKENEKSWFAFAKQKIAEVAILAKTLSGADTQAGLRRARLVKKKPTRLKLDQELASSERVGEY